MPKIRTCTAESQKFTCQSDYFQKIPYIWPTKLFTKTRRRRIIDAMSRKNAIMFCPQTVLLNPPSLLLRRKAQ